MSITTERRGIEMTDTQEAMREEFDAAWKTKSGLDENSYIGYGQAFVVWKLATEHERNNRWVRDKPFRDAHKDIDANLAGWDYIKKLEHEAAQSAEKMAKLEAENKRLELCNSAHWKERKFLAKVIDDKDKQLAAAELSNKQLWEAREKLDGAVEEYEGDDGNYMGVDMDDWHEFIEALVQQPSTEALAEYVAKVRKEAYEAGWKMSKELDAPLPPAPDNKDGILTKGV